MAAFKRPLTSWPAPTLANPRKDGEKMIRQIATLMLIVTVLIAGLSPVPVPAQIPVTDVAHISVSQWGWGATLTQWASQLSYMLRQYQQLMQTYVWAQHVAETLSHPDLFTVLPLFAVVDSATLTRIDNVSDFRHMVEGSMAYGANLGRLYERVYGEALDLGHMAPRGPEDWGAAAARMNTMIQNADAAALETLALVSQMNRSLSDINGSTGAYSQLRTQIQDTSVTPQQTVQAGAMSSLYAAQSVDKNTQVLSAMAAMQAQQIAQQESVMKEGLANVYTEQQYFTQSGTALRQEAEHVDSWKIQ
jgi:hypothetical protein